MILGGEGRCCELAGLAIATCCCEGDWQGSCCDSAGGLRCDGVCVMLVVEGCGVYTNDTSIMVFGIMDLALGVAWYCCGICCICHNC